MLVTIYGMIYFWLGSYAIFYCRILYIFSDTETLSLPLSIFQQNIVKIYVTVGSFRNLFVVPGFIVRINECYSFIVETKTALGLKARRQYLYNLRPRPPWNNAVGTFWWEVAVAIVNFDEAWFSVINIINSYFRMNTGLQGEAQWQYHWNPLRYL